MSCSTARPTRRSPTSASTPSRTRPGCTPPACAPTPDLRARRPRARRQPPRRARSPSSPGAPPSREGARGGDRADEDSAQRIVERVKQLEHSGFQFEAADGSFELLMRKEAGELRAAVSAGVLARDRRAARRRARRDRGHDQDLAGRTERYVRTAEGNGPVNALDRALRDAIGEIHPHLRDIELVNFKVRILDEDKGTGAVTRVLIDASDGQRRLGVDWGFRECDRGLLGRAGGLARVRDAARGGPTPARAWRRSCRSTPTPPSGRRARCGRRASR